MSEGLQRALGHVLHLLTVADIGFNEHHLVAAGCLQFTDNAPRLNFIDIRNDDVGAFAKQAFGDRLANVGRPTGDDCGLAC